MAFQLLQNQTSGHIKVKKGTGHVFYMATPSPTNESAISSTEVRLYATELTLLFQGSTGSSEGYKLFRDTDGIIQLIIAILPGIVVMELS